MSVWFFKSVYFTTKVISLSCPTYLAALRLSTHLECPEKDPELAKVAPRWLQDWRDFGDGLAMLAT